MGGLAAVAVLIGIIGVYSVLTGHSSSERARSSQAARGDIPAPVQQQTGNDVEVVAPKPPGEKGSTILNDKADPTIAIPVADAERVKRATTLIKALLPGGGISQGSGFFAVQKGIILTNGHVLGMLTPDTRLPQRVQAICNSGGPDQQMYEAMVLGLDRSSNLAILHVVGERLPDPLEIKSIRKLSGTKRVFVFGCPLGERTGKNLSLDELSITSLRKELGTDSVQEFQINGSLHPGSSGGPVVTA
jgi:S1-C subfamily serine protease